MRTAGAAAARSDFLLSQIAKHVVSELLCAAEEASLRGCHALADANLLLDELDRANEVCDLKETVSLWPDGLRELDLDSWRCDKRAMKEVRHGGLPAVIVDLHAVKRTHNTPLFVKEFRKAITEDADNHRGRRDVLLVHDETAVAEIDMAGESHHRGEDAVAETPIHDGEDLFLSDERAGVEAELFDMQVAKSEVECVQLLRNVNRLVVKDKRDDVKARVRVGMPKASRFVDKHAQCLLVHSQNQR